MGYIKHDAVVVIGGDCSKAHDKAVELGLHVTPIGPTVTNGYSSFLVCPDGSKEGWGTSSDHDDRRATFLEWVRNEQKGWDTVSALHVRFGGDDDGFSSNLVRSRNG